MSEIKRNFLSKKRNVMIPLVLILGVFIGGVVVLQTKGIGAQLLSEGKKIFIPVADEPDADPDNDGLKNWEEEIHKTDPRKYDTDGDGYSDGEEVLSGYDPTRPGPDDALSGTDTTVPRPAPQNLTEYLSQLVTEKITSGKIKPVYNIDTAPDSTLLANEDILNEALLEIGRKANEEFVLPYIPDSEIKISETETTKEEVLSYVSKMSTILNDDKAYTDLEISEAEIIESTVSTKNFKNIEIVINFYQGGIEKIKQVTVPQDFSDIHKEQIAIFELTKKILVAIRNFEKDPATAAAAAEKYPELKNIIENFTDKLTGKVSEFSE